MNAHFYVRRAWGFLCLAALCCAAAGCSSAESKETVTVLAAASTADAMEEIARLFEEETGGTVKISTGPSNGLATQIIEGAPADVFVSASEQWGEALEKEGLAVASVDLLTNKIVLVVPKGNPANVKQPSDLVSNKVKRVAIAGEKVPAGMYAEQALKSLKLFDDLEDKLARGQDVRVTLTYVELGEAEAGIVYATDARISKDVEVVYEFDAKLHEQVVYPVVLLKSSGENALAKEFFDFLKSPKSLDVFKRHGFTALPATLN